MLRAPLAGERAAARARAAVHGFRPLRVASAAAEPRVLLSGFAAFPDTPRNATEEMVRGLGIELRAGRAAGFAVGRGRVRLPSGRFALASVMVLPVVWDAAAMLVAKEARAFRPTVILMSGVARPVQPLLVERAASPVRAGAGDAWGLRPARRVPFAGARPLPLRFEVVEHAAREAIESEVRETPALGEVLLGVAAGQARADNAYVCNATAHGVVTLLRRSARMLRSRSVPDGLRAERALLGRVDCGFLHWPRDLARDHVAACGRVLLGVVDALV